MSTDTTRPSLAIELERLKAIETMSRGENLRDIQEVFGDLQSLMSSPGSLHEISAIIYRDWVTPVDTANYKVDVEHELRWSTAKLNKNELMLLVGLCAQASDDRVWSECQENGSEFIATLDTLLREMHDVLLSDIKSDLNAASEGTFVGPSDDAVATLAREAIYYGAEGFYLHQFKYYSERRYKADDDWLLEHHGLSIGDMIEIAEYLADRSNLGMTYVVNERERGHQFTSGDLTNTLMTSKAELVEKFGSKADAFLSKFLLRIGAENREFTEPFSINRAMVSPLIEIGDFIYLPNQFRLFESIYESPFYWMNDDKKYLATASKHRGEFVERAASELLKKVFGAENVYENVLIKSGKNDLGEIDVLVLYGEFAIIVQAKSKRLTLQARSGDKLALSRDYKGAVLDPYSQACECINAIESGATCSTQEGQKLDLHCLPRFFPMVVMSDTFPSSTHLSRTFLSESRDLTPIIWDLGTLDCVCDILPSPTDFLFYLKARADAFDCIMSDSEFNLLGYHLQMKLALPPDCDVLHVDRDFASIVDDYMVCKDVGVDANRPIGIIEQTQFPAISELITHLKDSGPEVSSVVIDLIDFSAAALRDVSNLVLQIRREVRDLQKDIKAFSIPTGSGGLTYAVVSQLSPVAIESAKRIGEKHKYDRQADRWYVFVDSVDSELPVDGMFALTWEWKQDLEEERASQEIARIFNSREDRREIGSSD